MSTTIPQRDPRNDVSVVLEAGAGFLVTVSGRAVAGLRPVDVRVA